MGKLLRTGGLAWAAALAALFLLLARPAPMPDDLAEWFFFAALIALLINLGRRTARGLVSPAMTGVLLAYLTLGAGASPAEALWCIASGSAAGHALWLARLLPARRDAVERVTLAHHFLLGAARLVLGAFAGGALYQALDGTLPLRALSEADALPLAGLAGGYVLVAVGLRTLERLLIGRGWRGPGEAELPALVAITLLPLPLAPLGAVAYHALGAGVFALVIGNLLIFVLAIRLTTDARLRLRQQVDELSSLSTVSRAISTALPLDDLLKLVAQQALTLLDASRCEVALLEPDQQRVRVLRVQRGGPVVSGEPRPLGSGLLDHVIRERAPLLIADQVAARARTLQLAAPDEAVESWMGVPLLAADRVLGCLAVTSEDPARRFTTGDMELLGTLSAQVGVVATNARLDAQAEDRAQRLALLNNVASTLSGTLEVQPMLDLISASAQAVGSCDAMALYLWPEGTTHELVLVRQRGLSDRFATAPPDPLLLVVNDLVRRRQPLIVSDAHTDRRARHLRPRLDAEGKRAWIEFLLRKGDDLLGVLVCYYDEPRTFSPDLIELLRNFASQAGLALRNAQLFTRTHEALQRRVDQLFALAEISRELAAMLDLNRLFQLVLNRAAEATGSQSGALLLRASRRGAPPRLVASRGLDLAHFDPISILAGAIAYTYQTGYPTLIPDTIHEAEYIPLVEGTRAQLNVPIVRGDDVLGVIVLGSDRPNFYDDDDQSFVMQLATQARIAIDNARLFQRIEIERDRLQIILDSMKEAVVLIDAAGRFALANPRVETLFGLDPAALLGRPVSALVRDPALALADRFGFKGEGLARLVATLEEGTWDASLQDGSRTSYEVSAPRPRWIDRVVVPVRDGPGATIGVLLVFSDMTRERELAQAREDLSRMIVHDLRGPLTAISTGLKLLRDVASGHGALGETVVQTTDTSGRAVRKMLGLVDSLLDIAKLENGVMKLEREPVLFPSVCRAVIEEYAPLAEDLAIHLRADLRAGLPALYVDEEKVERVLLNLVDNATKFTPAEGYIIVRAAPLPAGEGAEPMVQITVEDNGPGIPDEDKERLFNRFTQLETRQGRRRGTGLGLAFCRLAVEAHGGRIWIEDAPDGGARFVFTLPAVNIPEWELSDDWEAEAE